MKYNWKINWAESREHFIKWWNHDGLVISTWGNYDANAPHADVPGPGTVPPKYEQHTNAEWLTRNNHYQMSRKDYLGDILPLAYLGQPWLGPLLGATPEFAPTTTWVHPIYADVENPEELPPFHFDPENKWWLLMEDIMRRSVALGAGKYMVPFPFGFETLDVISQLRGPEATMMDLVLRPEWVQKKMEEIHQFNVEVYRRSYEILKCDDGSLPVMPLRHWSPGKTGLIQCDASAMISPDMFEQFVLPYVRRTCQMLDYPVYHLDGSQAVQHLDLLLSIPELKAIQWTAEPSVPDGADPHWYPAYRKILDAGKSIEIADIHAHQVIPVLDAIGAKGLYFLIHQPDRQTFEKLMRDVQKYYS